MGGKGIIIAATNTETTNKNPVEHDKISCPENFLRMIKTVALEQREDSPEWWPALVFDDYSELQVLLGQYSKLSEKLLWCQDARVGCFVEYIERSKQNKIVKETKIATLFGPVRNRRIFWEEDIRESKSIFISLPEMMVYHGCGYSDWEKAMDEAMVFVSYLTKAVDPKTTQDIPGVLNIFDESFEKNHQSTLPFIGKKECCSMPEKDDSMTLVTYEGEEGEEVGRDNALISNEYNISILEKNAATGKCRKDRRENLYQMEFSENKRNSQMNLSENKSDSLLINETRDVEVSLRLRNPRASISPLSSKENVFIIPRMRKRNANSNSIPSKRTATKKRKIVCSQPPYVKRKSASSQRSTGAKHHKPVMNSSESAIPTDGNVFHILRKLGYRCIDGSWFRPGKKPGKKELTLGYDYFDSLLHLRKFLCKNGVETSNKLGLLPEKEKNSLHEWVRNFICPALYRKRTIPYEVSCDPLAPTEVRLLLLKLGFHFRGGYYFEPHIKPKFKGIALNGYTLDEENGLIARLCRMGLPQDCAFNQITQLERLRLELYITNCKHVDTFYFHEKSATLVDNSSIFQQEESTDVSQ